MNDSERGTESRNREALIHDLREKVASLELQNEELRARIKALEAVILEPDRIKLAELGLDFATYQLAKREQAEGKHILLQYVIKEWPTSEKQVDDLGLDYATYKASKEAQARGEKPIPIEELIARCGALRPEYAWCGLEPGHDGPHAPEKQKEDAPCPVCGHGLVSGCPQGCRCSEG